MAHVCWAILIIAAHVGRVAAGKHHAVEIHLHGFTAIESSDCLGGVLKGPVNTSEQVHKIGGTRVFVASTDLIPHEYVHSGRITLDQCSQIASRASHHVLGFAWGTAGEVPSGLFSISWGGGRISEFEAFLEDVPEEHFGCIIYVAPAEDESAPPESFSCGSAADLCHQLDFDPKLELAGNPQPAKWLCCQQELSLFGMISHVSSVHGFWFAYRRTAHFEPDCDNTGVAVTKPIESGIVQLGGITVFTTMLWAFEQMQKCFLKSTRGTEVKVFNGPRVFIFWCTKMLSSLYWGAYFQVQMALESSLNFKTSVTSTIAAWLWAFFLTIIFTGIFNDLPASLLKWVLLNRKQPWEFTWSLLMISLSSMWFDMMLSFFYNPMVVKLIGHLPWILGFVSFLGSLIGRVLLNFAWFAVSQKGVPMLFDNGEEGNMSIKYSPLVTELAEPVATDVA